LINVTQHSPSMSSAYNTASYTTLMCLQLGLKQPAYGYGSSGQIRSGQVIEKGPAKVTKPWGRFVAGWSFATSGHTCSTGMFLSSTNLMLKAHSRPGLLMN